MLQKQIQIQTTERRRKDQLGHAALLYPDEDNGGWTLESHCNFFVDYFCRLQIRHSNTKYKTLINEQIGFTSIYVIQYKLIIMYLFMLSTLAFFFQSPFYKTQNTKRQCIIYTVYKVLKGFSPATSTCAN